MAQTPTAHISHARIDHIKHRSVLDPRDQMCCCSAVQQEPILHYFVPLPPAPLHPPCPLVRGGCVRVLPLWCRPTVPFVLQAEPAKRDEGAGPNERSGRDSSLSCACLSGVVAVFGV